MGTVKNDFAKWASIAIAAIGVALAIGSQIYFSRSEGQTLNTKLDGHMRESSSLHQRQEETSNKLTNKLETLQIQQHRIDTNIQLIGERLRVRNLRNGEKDNGVEIP